MSICESWVSHPNFELCCLLHHTAAPCNRGLYSKRASWAVKFPASGETERGIHAQFHQRCLYERRKKSLESYKDRSSASRMQALRFYGTDDEAHQFACDSWIFNGACTQHLAQRRCQVPNVTVVFLKLSEEEDHREGRKDFLLRRDCHEGELVIVPATHVTPASLPLVHMRSPSQLLL